MTTAPEKKKFRESAVIVLVRGEGADLEVFWVRRSDEVAVQPGFFAFLGGKVDPGDADLPLEGLADDVTRAACACAIREAFEEAGVLVGLAAPCDPAALPAARAELVEGRATFAELAARHAWTFDASRLDFAGRWQTPPFAQVRFDALYFLAHVPDGQSPHVTPGELAFGEWVRPAAAIERWRTGDVTFVAPILWTLRALADPAPGLAARLASAPERARTPAPRIEMKWGVVLHPMKTRPLPPADHTNAYFIGDREVALVDPGSADAEELAKLFAVADALAADGRRVKWIVATHHHPDHVAGLEACRAHGPWRLVALHTPGHTRDSLSLYDPRTRALWCGDLIPGGAGTVIVDPPDGDMRDYLDSLEALLARPLDVLFPGHGTPQGAVHRRVRALIRHRLEREAKVAAALGDAPRTAAELLPAVYDDVKPELWIYAGRSLVAHLEKLEADRAAVREGGGWRRARA